MYNDATQSAGRHRLPDAAQIVIYSFMTIDELKDKICKLSSRDRSMLIRPQI